MSTTTPPSPQLKILMLHGYTQTGPLFHAKTRAHQKLLLRALYPPTPTATHADQESRIKFLYPTGPIALLPPDIPGYNPENPPAEAYGWWKRETGGEKYIGLEEGLDRIAQTIAEELEADGKGIDGVIGFSQGGAAAGMVASLLEEGREEAFTSQKQGFAYPETFRKLKSAGQKPLKFAVSYSGFLPTSELYTAFWEPKLETRFLHVLGSLDSVVDEGRSLALAEKGADGRWEVVRHPGGHFVPVGKEMSGALVGFVKGCLEGGGDGKKEEEESVEDMDVPF